MKKFILIFALTIVATGFPGEKVRFDPSANTLEFQEVYLLNNPSICFHVLTYIVAEEGLPYGIGLKVAPMGEGSYQLTGPCDTSPDTPYFDGISGNLVIPELDAGGKTYVVNLRFDQGRAEFYIVSIKEKSEISYGKEELIGYCNYEVNGDAAGCNELYYVGSGSDKESVVENVEKMCKMQGSPFIRDHCPIYNDFTFACKIKILDSLSQITYYKGGYDQSVIESMRKACESYGGEFIKGSY